MNLITPKEVIFLRYLLKGTVNVCVNTSKIGVVLPQNLYDIPGVRLEIGFNMPVHIPDLECDEDGLRATLSFNRTPFRVSVPWYSVFQIDSPSLEEACTWADDAPVVRQELPSTGTDSATSHQHRDAYVSELRPPPSTKPKRQLPPGWGGIVSNINETNDKEPA